MTPTDYVRLGWALVPIPAGQKGPQGSAWQQPENLVTGPERAARLRGNIGLAHVPSGTFALDVDALEPARAWLGARGCDLDALLRAPDRVAISSGREGRAKLLYKRPAGWTPRTRKVEGLEFRCASRKGTTMQDVLPPSIHPDTGRPYSWDLGECASIDAMPEVPEVLRRIVDELNAVDDTSSAAAPPQGVPRDRIAAALEHWNPDGPYDDWLAAGMALHHESRGEPWGLALWDQWSARGAKYQGHEDLATRWRGFRSDDPNGVTIGRILGRDTAGPEEFDDLTRTPEGKPKPGKFRFEPSAEVPVFQPIDWLIKHVLPAAKLGVLYGEPGAGKSFIALDLAMALATGTPWRDRRVKAGAVAYICAEGATGFRRRYAAYLSARQIEPATVPFWFLAGAPNLHGADHTEVVRALRAAPVSDLRLIVIDTLARTMAGADENSGEDMGAYIQHAERLAELTGAMVLIVHHAGKDASRGARGWSGLKGAVDVEFEVTQSGDGPWRTFTVTKQKDGEALRPMQFKLNPVIVGLDEDGEEAASCVVEHGPEEDAPSARVTDRNRFITTILSAVDESIDVATGEAELESVYVAAMRQLPYDPAEGRDRRRQYVRQALERLVLGGKLLVTDGVVRRPG